MEFQSWDVIYVYRDNYLGIRELFSCCNNADSGGVVISKETCSI